MLPALSLAHSCFRETGQDCNILALQMITETFVVIALHHRYELTHRPRPEPLTTIKGKAEERKKPTRMDRAGRGAARGPRCIRGTLTTRSCVFCSTGRVAASDGRQPCPISVATTQHTQRTHTTGVPLGRLPRGGPILLRRALLHFDKTSHRKFEGGRWRN